MLERIEELKKRLVLYNANLLSVDPQISQQFPSPVNLGMVDSPGVLSFPIDLFSGNISIRLAICLLNQIENNVRILENRMVQFLSNKVGDYIEYYDVYSAFLAINAMRVEPGAKLEITAGVGAFSTRADPKIIIDGKPCSISEDGACHYTFSAPKTPGKYKTHVTVKFLDGMGKMDTVEKDVTYSVAR